MPGLFRALIFLVVPTAAFLTFLLQPIVGKQLMPRYGGTAGTWMTISFFFQTALLAGYAFAAWILRQDRRRATRVLIVLALLAPLTAKLPPWQFQGWSEWVGVLAALATSLLPTVLLTTSIGIVLQGWIRDRDGAVPYGLYGISNLGSLLALLAYPFVIEPRVGLATQSRAAQGLLWILGLSVTALAVFEKRVDPSRERNRDERSEPIAPKTIMLWCGIAFSTCTLMLGGVRILSAEIGSNPLSWLIPLGTYLLSFTLTFSGRWGRSLTLIALVALGVGLTGFMETKGITNSVLGYWPRLWLVSMLLGGTLAGHGWLYQLRPARRFTFFYLVLAGAGMLAGLFASVIAPVIFDRNLEFVGAGVLLAGGAGAALIARAGWKERVAFMILAIGPAAWFGAEKIFAERRLSTKITYLRNHYGTLVLMDNAFFLSASNETTLHGIQLHDPEKKDLPTSYYTHGSGVGMVIAALQQDYPSIRIGVVGLGTGTLASYLRKPDEIVFWDINPLALRVARENFSFLADSPGKVTVRLVDGRIGLRSAPERFDLLVIDAFSGDYIPLHLLTREAMEEYLARVGDGMLLYHVSNRYAHLVPVIAGSAYRLGRGLRVVAASPGETVKVSEEASRTEYVLVYPKSRDKEVDRWVLDQLKNQDYHYEISFPAEREVIDWTDDRQAIVDVLWK